MGAPATTSGIVPAAQVSSFCSSVHALAGFVPGVFACSYPIPGAPSGRQYSVSLGSDTSQSQELYIYVN